MNLDEGWFESGDGCGCGCVAGLKLSTAPDLTRVGAKVDRAIQRFHCGVCKIRDFEFSGDCFGRVGDCLCGITDFTRYQAWRLRKLRKLFSHSCGRKTRVRAVVPFDLQFVTAKLRRPKPFCDQ